jgi:hypothetical protein
LRLGNEGRRFLDFQFPDFSQVGRDRRGFCDLNETGTNCGYGGGGNSPSSKPRNARRVWVFMFFSSLVAQSLGSKGVKQPGQAM